METRLPFWIVLAIVVQLILAGLFGLLAYSMTSSLRQGATPSLIDTVSVALPFAMVAICGIAARAMWRSGRRSAVPLIVFAPLPAYIVLLFLSGAVL